MSLSFYGLSFYGLSFNPFNKQMVKEKDRFLSHDLKQMSQELDYLKDARGQTSTTWNISVSPPSVSWNSTGSSVLSSGWTLSVGNPVCLNPYRHRFTILPL